MRFSSNPKWDFQLQVVGSVLSVLWRGFYLRVSENSFGFARERLLWAYAENTMIMMLRELGVSPVGKKW